MPRHRDQTDDRGVERNKAAEAGEWRETHQDSHQGLSACHARGLGRATSAGEVGEEEDER